MRLARTMVVVWVAHDDAAARCGAGGVVADDQTDRYSHRRAVPRRRRAPLTNYVGLLHALATLDRTLEQDFLPAASPAVAAVWDAQMGKLPLLKQDLATFADRRLPAIPRAALNALVLSDLSFYRVRSSCPGGRTRQQRAPAWHAVRWSA